MAIPKRPNEALNDSSLPSGLTQAEKTVATAGIAEALASATSIKAVTVRALTGNTNNIFVGGSDVDSSNGFILAAGDTASFEIDDLANVFLDVTTDGEGARYIAVLA